MPPRFPSGTSLRVLRDYSSRLSLDLSQRFSEIPIGLPPRISTGVCHAISSEVQRKALHGVPLRISVGLPTGFFSRNSLELVLSPPFYSLRFSLDFSLRSSLDSYRKFLSRFPPKVPCRASSGVSFRILVGVHSGISPRVACAICFKDSSSFFRSFLGFFPGVFFRISAEVSSGTFLGILRGLLLQVSS